MMTDLAFTFQLQAPEETQPQLSPCILAPFDNQVGGWAEVAYRGGVGKMVFE